MKINNIYTHTYLYIYYFNLQSYKYNKISYIKGHWHQSVDACAVDETRYFVSVPVPCSVLGELSVVQTAKCLAWEPGSFVSLRYGH